MDSHATRKADAVSGTTRRMLLLLLLCAIRAPGSVRAQDSVVVRFLDAELGAVFQALGQYLPKPLLLSGLPSDRITVDYPSPVPRISIPDLLKGIAQLKGLEFREEATYFQVAARSPAPPVPPGPSPGDVPTLTVIRLRHAKAADVAATINILFGGTGEFSGRTGLSSGTLSEELRRLPVANGAQQPAAPPSPGGEGGAVLRGAVTVVPDELTNALLVRATPADADVIRQAAEQLDERPLQVMIEVLIIEARRDRDFSLGSILEVDHASGSYTYGGGLSGGGTGDLVLQVMKMGRTQINGLLSLAQSRGDVDIVSRPVLVAANNTEAHFLVGSQRPFVQVSRSLPTDAPSRDQVVQYKDVGTKVTVLPTINHDGYVSLVIQQEISAATAENQFDAPVISTREARTQVLVRDGQTIVLGGLRDELRDKVQTGIPILSSIPILGGLFGRASRRSSTTELFLFLTPKVLRTDEDVDTVTQPRLPEREKTP